MNRPVNCACLVLILTFFTGGPPLIPRGLHEQTSRAAAAVRQFDPMKYVTDSFPNTIKFKQNGHLLEFCPDNTCEGFSSSAKTPKATLEDFAYLYIYYFSEYIYLSDWRSHAEAKDAAERVLSEPAYRHCKTES